MAITDASRTTVSRGMAIVESARTLISQCARLHQPAEMSRPWYRKPWYPTRRSSRAHHKKMNCWSVKIQSDEKIVTFTLFETPTVR
jgi:hypothetical protein